MALWNHLVPDLVELSVQEREVDKLPHSKYPIDEDTKNEAKNGGHHGGGSGGYHSPHDKSKTTNSAGGGSQKDGSSAKNPTLNRERISEVITQGAFISNHLCSKTIFVKAKLLTL